jgi:hypothetical protein
MKYFNFVLVLTFICFVSCIFTDYVEDNFDLDDSKFIEYGHSYPIYSLNNININNNYAFCGDGYGTLSVFDLFSPHYPYLYSNTNMFVNNQIKKIEIYHGTTAFIAMGNGGLLTYSILSPQNPVEIAPRINVNALDISLDGNYLAVTDDNSWRIYSISGSSLYEICYYEYFIYTQPKMLHLKNGWLYVFSDNRMDIFDVTNPYNIELISPQIYYNNFIDYQYLDNFITVATSSFFYFIDISNPFNAYVAKHYGFSYSPLKISISGSYFFVAWQNQTVSAYKIYSIFQIEEKSRISFNHNVTDFNFKNNFLYLSCANSGLKIYYINF